MRATLEGRLAFLRSLQQEKLLEAHVLLGRIVEIEDLIKALPVEPESTGDTPKEVTSVEL